MDQHESTILSNMKNGCLSFYIYFQECFSYCKAFVVGQGKKLLARNEKEATLADLQMAKMQVDATDAAENKKKHIHDS
ncbi:hypothetical protein BVRB_1g005430 [Beta vulgaris subsp. vulgaris]|nr:hypothetical protein BVRB_1g005430 [Beta vulgaris subsp. vulgaris]